MEKRASRFVWQSGELELMSSPYLIHAESRIVRAWVPFRPPFQPPPNSPSSRFRADLRQAVSRLERESESEILRCEYASSGTDLVDAENVLVYNLGPAHLASTGAAGVRFVRTSTEPPAPPVALAPPGRTHYLEYGFTEAASEDSIKPGKILAIWHDVLWPDTSSVPKVGALWFALRATHPGVYGRLDDPMAPFGIRVEIEGGEAVPHPVHILKPLLDAVVSAFHLSADSTDLVVATHVAEQARTADTNKVEAFLSDERYNVLGSRAVVGSYRGGVKWNPADERCVLAQVTLKRREGRPTFSGQLFAIS